MKNDCRLPSNCPMKWVSHLFGSLSILVICKRERTGRRLNSTTMALSFSILKVATQTKPVILKRTNLGHSDWPITKRNSSKIFRGSSRLRKNGCARRKTKFPLISFQIKSAVSLPRTSTLEYQSHLSRSTFQSTNSPGRRLLCSGVVLQWMLPFSCAICAPPMSFL